METIPRNDFDTRNRYDAFCKAVLRNEAKNYLSEMARHRDREKSLEALTQQELDKLTTVDHYPSDSYVFSSHGYDLRIDNELVAEAFACSLRMGEILGLTWSNVHISDEDIADDNAYVYIDKELARASKRAIEMLGQKDIYHVFTPLFPNTSTRIILKKPKTDSSIRKVWLPKTLAYILREWKSAQDELRALLRDEYQDYDLVVALANGRPCEDRIILKSFEKLREKAGLPNGQLKRWVRRISTTSSLRSCRTPAQELF